MDDPLECAICWDKFTSPIVLNCGHTFDEQCILLLDHCPLCRQPITTRNVNWQLVYVLESAGNGDVHAERENGDIASNKSRFTPLYSWLDPPLGTMIKYKLVGSSIENYGWFIRFDIDEDIVYICRSQGGTIELPRNRIVDPRMIITGRNKYKGCCIII